MASVDMGSIEVIAERVHFRNRAGQFVAQVEEGLIEAVEDLARRAESYAEAFAPVRTGELRGSIFSIPQGTTAIVGANAAHARFQEFGTGPKGAAGQFLTNREDFAAIGPVGPTPATHFLSQSQKAAAAEGESIIARHLP